MPEIPPLTSIDGISDPAVLGQGPRAVVYRAVWQPTRQPVALRVINTAIPDESRATFDERRAAVRTTSAAPAFADIYDSGWLADGRPYLVTELGSGSYGDLAAGPVPAADVIAAGAVIAEGLVVAHQADVLHGQIKPGNLIRCADGTRLTDFSLDIPADRAPGAPPSFAPPETIWGISRTPSNDVYGLCATLYSLLLGHPPRRLGSQFPDVIRIRELFDLPLPALPGIPADLATLLKRGISYEPVARPSMFELRDAFARHHTTAAAADPTPEGDAPPTFDWRPVDPEPQPATPPPAVSTTAVSEPAVSTTAVSPAALSVPAVSTATGSTATGSAATGSTATGSAATGSAAAVSAATGEVAPFDATDAHGPANSSTASTSANDKTAADNSAGDETAGDKSPGDRTSGDATAGAGAAGDKPTTELPRATARPAAAVPPGDIASRTTTMGIAGPRPEPATPTVYHSGPSAPAVRARRRRTALIATGACAVLLIGGGGWFSYAQGHRNDALVTASQTTGPSASEQPSPTGQTGPVDVASPTPSTPESTSSSPSPSPSKPRPSPSKSSPSPTPPVCPNNGQGDFTMFASGILDGKQMSGTTTLHLRNRKSGSLRAWTDNGWAGTADRDTYRSKGITLFKEDDTFVGTGTRNVPSKVGQRAKSSWRSKNTKQATGSGSFWLTRLTDNC